MPVLNKSHAPSAIHFLAHTDFIETPDSADEVRRSEIARELEFQQQQLADALEHSLDQVIDDDILRLIFTACHPILPMEGRIALTLRLIGGLTTTEIARAFLVPEKTLGQRISRAKKTLSEAHVPFETQAATNCTAG
jgi:RNA polymerase sigma-70 factor (ECF subfamily)